MFLASMYLPTYRFNIRHLGCMSPKLVFVHRAHLMIGHVAYESRDVAVILRPDAEVILEVTSRI
jgi:hypothetical protein